MTNNMAQMTDADGLGVSNYTFRYNINNGSDNGNMAYLVISNGSHVSNVEISINGHIFNESLEIGKPSMVLLKDVLSEDESQKSINFDCRYFDENNKELKVE